MAKDRIRKDQLRVLVEEAKANASALSVLSAWAHRHLGDGEGKAESEKLGKNIQAVLSQVLRYLDSQDDEIEIEDERGMHNAKLETLIEKRDRMNERIAKMGGNNSHAAPLR